MKTESVCDVCKGEGCVSAGTEVVSCPKCSTIQNSVTAHSQWTKACHYPGCNGRFFAANSWEVATMVEEHYKSHHAEPVSAESRPTIGDHATCAHCANPITAYGQTDKLWWSHDHTRRNSCGFAATPASLSLLPVRPSPIVKWTGASLPVGESTRWTDQDLYDAYLLGCEDDCLPAHDKDMFLAVWEDVKDVQ